MTTANEYDAKADEFLKSGGITFRAVLKDTRRPVWVEGRSFGHHYRVTLSKPGKRLSFDFFGSAHDKSSGILTERAYNVLSCLSGDVTTPDTFENFCAEYGYDADSRKAYATYKRCHAFALRLRNFFTADEIEKLQEIQ